MAALLRRPLRAFSLSKRIEFHPYACLDLLVNVACETELDAGRCKCKAESHPSTLLTEPRPRGRAGFL